MAHMIMEAEKPHSVLSTNWRPREASCVVPVRTQELKTRTISIQVQKPKNQECQWLRAREDGCPNSNKRANFPSFDFLSIKVQRANQTMQ